MKISDRYAILYVLSALLLCGAGCGGHIKNLHSGGNNIICFGDSITSGEGAGKGEDYPSRLSALLNRDVINAGASGDTTDKALERLERDVLRQSPYIVIVELGGNDFLQNIPKDHTIENLRTIISEIQQEGAMVALCDTSSGFVFTTYKGDYKNLARETGSIFIPGILDGILTDPSLKADKIHPNAEGYKVIAQRIYQSIRRYLK